MQLILRNDHTVFWNKNQSLTEKNIRRVPSLFPMTILIFHLTTFQFNLDCCPDFSSLDNLAAYHVWTFFKVTKWIKWNRKQIKSRQRTQGLIFTKRRHSFCNWTDPFHVKINGYCLLLLLKLAILRKVVYFIRAQKIFGKLFVKKNLGWQQCCKINT